MLNKVLCNSRRHGYPTRPRRSAEPATRLSACGQSLLLGTGRACRLVSRRTAGYGSLRLGAGECHHSGRRGADPGGLGAWAATAVRPRSVRRRRCSFHFSGRGRPITFFIDMRPFEEAAETLKSLTRLPPRAVVPVSVVFASPPPRESGSPIVDDLGVPRASRRQNDRPRFWPGGGR